MNENAKKRRVRKWLFIGLLLIAVVAACGCETLSYYTQAVTGEFQILAHQKPIDGLIVNPQTPARLKKQLELVERLRAFAKKELKLPVDDHYEKFADLHRRYVVWNVQAAPEFSLQSKSWWYPIVGRLDYRGYFAERGARTCADDLKRKGYDVYVDGVEAYSTLGWFKDPVLNTFVYRSEPELAEVIFHELGHQRLFARGDTDFNEAFATAVGQEGAKRWLISRGETNLYKAYILSLERNDQFVRLIMCTRWRLEKIYGDTRGKEGKIKAAKKLPAPREQLEREKRRVFDDLRHDYERLKARWNGYAGYDDWFAHELNNAKLNSVADYYDFVPGFETLLKQNGGDLGKFYEAAERLSKLPREKRRQRLRELVSETPRLP